jgi:hypothetical protein
MSLWDWGIQHLHPSLQLSIVLMIVLGVAAVALRYGAPQLETARSFAREFAVVMGLQALWQYVGREVRTRSAGAFERAGDIERFERRVHLPNELTIQHWAIAHEWLVQAMNVYYATVHLDGTFVFLFWVWWKHRSAFRRLRNTLVTATLTCLLLQMIPVAPPRLLPGFVDTGLAYGESVYGPYATGLATQLTAMPSLHIGWAFIVAWYLTELGRGPWKALGWVHLAVTFLVIVATANHWWLDGLVAIAVVLVILALQKAISVALQEPGRDVGRVGAVLPEERRPVEA